MSSKSIDGKDFRCALGKFPTGVTIITAKDGEGKPVGITASSFNSVSIDPALILWSVDKGTYSASIFKEAEYFAVNVLSKAQMNLSNHFASRDEDKFSGIDYTECPNGSPLFNDCAAQFECKKWNVYEGGDHFIIIGEVIDYRYTLGAEPLVFAGGNYAVSALHPLLANNEKIL